MKKTIAVWLILLLFAYGASAEIHIADSANEGASMAEEAGLKAADAYYCPADALLYFLSTTASGCDVSAYDASTGKTETLVHLGPEASYSCVRADADGNVYLLRVSADDTAKSSILRIVQDENGYTSTEYPFPGATNALLPARMEFSPFSSSGFVTAALNENGEEARLLSVFNVFWGVLEGYDDFIAIQPGSLSAQTIPAANLFDAYGYAAEGARGLLAQYAAGTLLPIRGAALSPNGDKLLLEAEYQNETLMYIMDVYSLALEIVYPPDGFSGTIAWTADGGLRAVNDAGEPVEIAMEGFESDDWGSDWGADWTGGEEGGWSGDITDDWNNADGTSLDDWS